MEDEDFEETETQPEPEIVRAYPITPVTFAANLFGLARDLAGAFGKFFDACQDDCLAAHNQRGLTRQFHEQAAREIESITEE